MGAGGGCIRWRSSMFKNNNRQFGLRIKERINLFVSSGLNGHQRLVIFFGKFDNMSPHLNSALVLNA